MKRQQLVGFYPLKGPVTGNTNLTIRGTGFLDYNFVIKFGKKTYVYPDHIYNGTMVYCTT